MANLEATGKILKIGKTQEIGNKGFKKRAVLIKEDNDKADIQLYAEFQKDKCEILDNFKEGDSVTIKCNVSSREYEGKYYPSITAWNITKNSSSNNNSDSKPIKAKSDDDLPF